MIVINVTRTCTVPSEEAVEKVLCELGCKDLGFDTSRMVNSIKVNKSGNASSSSRNNRIQMYDDREETHIRHFTDR
jgi:hypothetical protein